MLTGFGQRQQELLKLLNKHKQGLTIDELAEAAGITRTAVRQHLATMEADGLVEHGPLRETAGRPSRLYRLAERGMEIFPRQYSWFSELMLASIRKERGADGLATWLRELAVSVASSFESELAGLPTEQRIARTIELMNQLSYEAEQASAEDGPEPAIDACNCVFHHLAMKFPEVCQFDLALLERMSGTGMTQTRCMVRGDQVCRFVPKETP